MGMHQDECTISVILWPKYWILSEHFQTKSFQNVAVYLKGIYLFNKQTHIELECIDLTRVDLV